MPDYHPLSLAGEPNSPTAVTTIREMVVPEVSQHPGGFPTERTAAIATIAKQPKKTQWLALRRDERRLIRVANALISPKTWITPNRQRTMGWSKQLAGM